jgi:hypothetical protein
MNKRKLSFETIKAIAPPELSWFLDIENKEHRLLNVIKIVHACKDDSYKMDALQGLFSDMTKILFSSTEGAELIKHGGGEYVVEKIHGIIPTMFRENRVFNKSEMFSLLQNSQAVSSYHVFNISKNVFGSDTHGTLFISPIHIRVFLNTRIMPSGEKQHNNIIVDGVSHGEGSCLTAVFGFEFTDPTKHFLFV